MIYSEISSNVWICRQNRSFEMYAYENLRNDKWVSVCWFSKIILFKAFTIAGGKRFQRFLFMLLREKNNWISSDPLCCHHQSLCIYIHALGRLHSRPDCIQGWSFDQVIHSLGINPMTLSSGHHEHCLNYRTTNMSSIHS